MGVEMEVEDAIIEVLGEDPAPLHWTVIQDRALRAGYVDPFEVGDVRARVLGSLAALSKAGRVRKVSKGTYALPEGSGEPER